MRLFGRDRAAVDIHQGEEFAIELEGAAGGGYEWFLTYDHGSGKLSPPKRTIVPGKGFGAGGMTRFQFFASAPGKVALNFELRRPWEQVPEDRHSFMIRII